MLSIHAGMPMCLWHCVRICVGSLCTKCSMIRDTLWGLVQGFRKMVCFLNHTSIFEGCSCSSMWKWTLTLICHKTFFWVAFKMKTSKLMDTNRQINFTEIYFTFLKIMDFTLELNIASVCGIGRNHRVFHRNMHLRLPWVHAVSTPKSNYIPLFKKNLSLCNLFLNCLFQRVGTTILHRFTPPSSSIEFCTLPVSPGILGQDKKLKLSRLKFYCWIFLMEEQVRLHGIFRVTDNGWCYGWRLRERVTFAVVQFFAMAHVDIQDLEAVKYNILLIIDITVPAKASYRDVEKLVSASEELSALWSAPRYDGSKLSAAPMTEKFPGSWRLWTLKFFVFVTMRCLQIRVPSTSSCR